MNFVPTVASLCFLCTLKHVFENVAPKRIPHVFNTIYLLCELFSVPFSKTGIKESLIAIKVQGAKYPIENFHITIMEIGYKVETG